MINIKDSIINIHLLIKIQEIYDLGHKNGINKNEIIKMFNELPGTSSGSSSSTEYFSATSSIKNGGALKATAPRRPAQISERMLLLKLLSDIKDLKQTVEDNKVDKKTIEKLLKTVEASTIDTRSQGNLRSFVGFIFKNFCNSILPTLFKILTGLGLLYGTYSSDIWMFPLSLGLLIILDNWRHIGTGIIPSLFFIGALFLIVEAGFRTPYLGNSENIINIAISWLRTYESSDIILDKIVEIYTIIVYNVYLSFYTILEYIPLTPRVIWSQHCPSTIENPVDIDISLFPKILRENNKCYDQSDWDNKLPYIDFYNYLPSIFFREMYARLYFISNSVRLITKKLNDYKLYFTKLFNVFNTWWGAANNNTREEAEKNAAEMGKKAADWTRENVIDNIDYVSNGISGLLTAGNTLFYNAIGGISHQSGGKLKGNKKTSKETIILDD